MNNCKTYGYPQQNSNENHNTSCKCTTMPALPEDPVVAMAYVPYQQCNDVYSCEKALSAGTAFPVLDKPFLAGYCR